MVTNPDDETFPHCDETVSPQRRKNPETEIAYLFVQRRRRHGASLGRNSDITTYGDTQ
jgi:hypothetical protein